MGSVDSNNGLVAVITGTASGMGKDLAESLYKQGYKIGCLDLNEARGQELAAGLGDRALFVKCDVADYDDQAAAFSKVFQKWGRLDAVLMNAGIVDRSSVYILDRRNSKEIPPAPDVSTTKVDYLGVVSVPVRRRRNSC